MTSTKYDETFDEMLEGKEFEGQNALEYLKGDFFDDELDQLNKQELKNLFAKAFVLICLKESEKNKHLDEESELLRENLELLRKNTEYLQMLLKHFEIYPDLAGAHKSELHFELVKNNAALNNLYVRSFTEIPKKLPEIKRKARASIPKSGGNARAANDKQHQNMEKVKKAYLEKWNEGYRFPHGTLSVFYEEMANKHSLDFAAIKNAIEKYRKELGHTNPKRKKQSS